MATEPRFRQTLVEWRDWLFILALGFVFFPSGQSRQIARAFLLRDKAFMDGVNKAIKDPDGRT